MPIQKNFLLRDSLLSPDACHALRAELGVDVIPDTAPPPAVSSDDVVLPKLFSTFMAHSKLTKPSAIQSQCWTAILSGQHVVAIGATGSGKTIAYLLPLVPHVLANRQQGCVTALVLLPTRELALQVTTIARSFRPLFGVSCYTIYGGVDKAEQEEHLARVGPDVLMASPGRLHDLHGTGKVSLSHVSYLVLDEADKMLEGSLGEQVRELSGLCLPEAQRLVFSATFPDHIQDAVRAFMGSSYVQVKVQEHAGVTTLGPHIKQTLHVTSDALHKKLRKILRTLIQIKSEHAAANPQARNRPSVMIFVNKIKTISAVVGCLQKSSQLIGTSRGLFGTMKQAEREDIVRGFRAGKISNLVTTDLAGRGMDIKNLNYVVNFDFPPTIAQYIHRIGRAGRQGQPSSTFTFFTRNRRGLAPHILEVLRQTKQWEDPNLLLLCKELEEEPEAQSGEQSGEDNVEGAKPQLEQSGGEEENGQNEQRELDDEKEPTRELTSSEEEHASAIPTKRKVAAGRRKTTKRKASDPFALPQWLVRGRTVVPDSDEST